MLTETETTTTEMGAQCTAGRQTNNQRTTKTSHTQIRHCIWSPLVAVHGRIGLDIFFIRGVHTAQRRMHTGVTGPDTILGAA